MMKQHSPNHQGTILIAAGGTGGHVMPALAVGHYLIEQGFQVHWVGTHLGIEHKLIPEQNIPLHYINISGLRKKGALKKLFAPFRILLAIMQSLGILLKVKPSVVLTMGGFVSGPVGIAAWLLRRPLIVHEQNAIGGVTNKILSKFANQVCLAYPNALPKAAKKSQVTGNPLRKEFFQSLSAHSIQAKKKQSDKIHILVFGGSQGALALNHLVPEALSLLPNIQDYEILHQTGEKHFEKTQERYSTFNLLAEIKPFINNMVEAYQWADIVICRAGALTVAEVSQIGKSCIFIPFPYAVDNHQYYNAQYLSLQNGALLLTEKSLKPEDLCQAIMSLSDVRIREKMSQVAMSLAKPKATELVANICIKAIR